ncbi:hypothetical protein MBLNU459_g1553t1 [Dothideomycetes sp. NU459]
MAFPRNSLRAFMRHAKDSLKLAIERKDEVTLVVGNESADLDSIASSIIYAYLRSIIPPSPSAAGRGSTSTSGLHIPLLNIPSTDIPLRPELLALLPRAGLEPEHLITLSDLPQLSSLQTSLPPASTTWILVDHNSLTGPLTPYNPRVRGCIDHHADEHTVPESGEPRTITKSGSCASLVTNHFSRDWDALSTQHDGDGTSSGGSSGGSSSNTSSNNVDATSAQQQQQQQQLWDAQAAQLALAPVLIDTHDLRDANKTTAHDTAAAAYLGAKIAACAQLPGPFDRTALFAELDAAKRDLDRLDLDGVLRKDYKMWDAAAPSASSGEQTGSEQQQQQQQPGQQEQEGLKIGIASVVKPLAWLRAKAQREAPAASARPPTRPDDDDAAAATHAEEEDGGWAGLVARSAAFARARHLSLFAVMTAFTAAGDEFARELLLVALDGRGAAAVDGFVARARDTLQLRSVGGVGVGAGADAGAGGVTGVQVWKQGNVAASRKQVAPLLREAGGAAAAAAAAA